MHINADIISVLKQMIDVTDEYAMCDMFDTVHVDFIFNTVCVWQGFYDYFLGQTQLIFSFSRVPTQEIFLPTQKKT